jgi:hypothetical protein
MGLELIFYAVFVLVLGNIVYQMMKKRGLMRTKLRVHRLEARDADSLTIGLEIVTTSVASYHTFPISLTSAQATMLIEHLAHGIQRQQPRAG